MFHESFDDEENDLDKIDDFKTYDYISNNVNGDCFEKLRTYKYLDAKQEVNKAFSTFLNKHKLEKYFEVDIGDILVLTSIENMKRTVKEKLLNFIVDNKLIESVATSYKITDGLTQYSPFSYIVLSSRKMTQNRRKTIFENIHFLYNTLERFLPNIRDLGQCIAKKIKHIHDWTVVRVNIGRDKLKHKFYTTTTKSGFVYDADHPYFISTYNVANNDDYKYNFFIELPVVFYLQKNGNKKRYVMTIRICEFAILDVNHEMNTQLMHSIRKYRITHSEQAHFSLNMKSLVFWKIYRKIYHSIPLFIVFGYMYECDTKKPNVEKLRLLDQFCESFMYTMPCTDQPFLRTVQAKLFEVAGSIKSIADVTDIVLRNHDLVKLYDQTIDEGVAMKGVYDEDASGVFYAQQPLTPQHTIFRFQNGVYALPHVGFLINSYYAMRKTVDAMIESFMLNRYAQINVQSISAESVDNSYY